MWFVDWAYSEGKDRQPLVPVKLGLVNLSSEELIVYNLMAIDYGMEDEETLNHTGRSHKNVAYELNDVFKNETLVSIDPTYTRAWLNRLSFLSGVDLDLTIVDASHVWEQGDVLKGVIFEIPSNLRIEDKLKLSKSYIVGEHMHKL